MGPEGQTSPEHETSSEETPGLLAWFARNSVAANMLVVVLFVGGLAFLFTQVKQEVFPEVEIDTVIINVPYPGASPEEVEQGVALAIEEAVRGLDGVKEVRSTCAEGTAVVAVELLLGTNKDRALNDVKSAVDRITSFPENMERPVIALATNRQQVVSLVLYGDADEQVLHDLAEQVRFGLLERDDITYVDIQGTRPLEISVEVPQRELREHRLTLQQVAGAIRSASVELPGGGIKTSSGEVLLRTAERRDRGAEFADITILGRPDGSLLRVGDIAEVRDGFREVDQESFFNGKRAVMVNVYRVGDQGPIEVAAATREYLETRLQPSLPPGVEAAVWNDRSEIYADRIDLLRRNAIMGLILVLVSLGLFLDPKLAFWVTLGIPVSFAGSMLFLPAADVTINMISLFGFIVTLGMVVDDAIVVGEAIYERRQQGVPYMKAAIDGVREVARPVIFAILTTCIAFSPLLFVPGVSGKFFRNIPLVVITVLLISLAESLLVLPAHLSHKMPRWLEWALSPILLPLRLLQMLKTERWLGWFVEKAFSPALKAAVSWRYLTFFAAVALLLGTCGIPASGRLQFTFLPKIEGDVINASLRMPVGTSVDETRAIQGRMVQAAQQLVSESGGEQILRGIYSSVGSAASMGSGPMGGGASAGSHLAGAQVFLVSIDRREITTADFAKRWRELIGEVAGAETLTFDYALGASAGKPVDVRLTHPDTATLEAAAARLAGQLGVYNGLRDIDSGVSPGKQQIDFTLRPEGRARGLTEAELARQIRDAFFGAEALRQQRGREEIRVYVRRPLDERVSLNELERLVVRTPDGGEMPLGQAAELHRGRAYTTISRVDGKRVISVTADIVEGVGNANQIVESVKKEELPALLADVPGLSYEMGGEQKEQARTLASLRIGAVLALFAMFGLLAVAFRSYIQPAIVMLGAIPFGIVGAIWGHVMLGFDLSMISIMGIVALSGVVINDSIVLIDAVNNLRAEGMGPLDAVLQAGARRFRPILLTSLTTFLGLMPMILETSVQARFLVPMAVSLGFGVMFATAILLLLVPASYIIVEDLRRILAIPPDVPVARPSAPAIASPEPGE